MKPLFATSILGATLSFLSVASHAQTPISSVPYTITAPGNYIISKNLVYSASSGSAITVNTSNVTINFNGFYIICPTANNDARGVYANAQNHITVKNGEIIGFGVGVMFDSPALGFRNSGHLVDAVRFTRCAGSGVLFQQSRACVVQNCQMVGGTFGVEFLAGFGNRATNNVASEESYGFYEDAGGTGGGDYFDSNYADHCTFGVYSDSNATKYRFNTTTNCINGVGGFGTSEGYLDQ